MLALERLSAPERAAFLLHDVFDQPYSEVARTLGRNEASCRQLALRARERVRERGRASRPPSRTACASPRPSCRRRAKATGALRQLLADDAVLHSGRRRQEGHAATGRGRRQVARFFAGIAGKPGGKLLGAAVVRLNGMPAVLGTDADGLPRSISLTSRMAGSWRSTWCATLISCAMSRPWRRASPPEPDAPYPLNDTT